MSKPINLHSSPGAINVIADVPGIGITFASGATVPADNSVGYAPGCVFSNTSGSTINTVVYANIGTKAACNFDPLKG